MPDDEEKDKEKASLEEIKRQWEKKLKDLEEREHQLIKFDDMLKKREEEWKSRIDKEEIRLTEEHDRREAELSKRERELDEDIISDEETLQSPEQKELLEIKKRMEEKEQDLKQRQEQLSQQKQGLEIGEVKQTEQTYAKLKKEMEGLGDDAIVLVSCRAESHMRMILALLAIVLNEKSQGGVYISVSRPFRYILNNLEENDIEIEDLFAIDCVSRMAGKVSEKMDTVAYVENPSSLEEISMYMDRMLMKVGSGKKFILLDSLSSILIYNNQKSVKEFTHFIINKMRLEGLGGFILTQEKKEAQDLIQTIQPLLDKEIHL
ncbi:MAG: hypothetical protein ABH950_04480 [Candidatus Altiarchaeota archaeon]